MTKGKIFDIKHFAVHDGPGIRTTVFFKGCPLSCLWCHNPEGIKKKDELFFYQSKCIYCGRCVEVCHKQAIFTKDDEINIDWNECDSCGGCVDICPSEAMQMAGKRVSVEDVLDEVDRSTIFHDTSEGGITLSGGEPFYQYDFMKELVKRCGEEDIHVAVDTSGHVKPKKFHSVMDKIDLFLYDLKFIDESLHKKYTGISNRYILKNLETLMEKGDNDVYIRIPLIPDITTDKKNIECIIDFLSSFKGIREIHLLKYHNVEEKYKRLGKTYELKDLDTCSRSSVDKIIKRFENEGYKVKEGG